jgi:hypothetical protein
MGTQSKAHTHVQRAEQVLVDVAGPYIAKCNDLSDNS